MLIFFSSTDDDDECDWKVYKINEYGKIVVGDKEVYYGKIVGIDLNLNTALLLVKDWRDKENQSISFCEMVVPITKFTIKYQGDLEWVN